MHVFSHQDLQRARVGVLVVFALNGFAFANWASRTPQIRDALELNPGQLGTLLLAATIAAVISLPLASLLIHRWGAARVTGGSAFGAALGLAAVGITISAGHYWLTAAALFSFGLCIGAYDVAMNVEGAAVEHGLSRSVMPHFHASFSLGAVAGAGAGAAAAALNVPLWLHLAAASILCGLIPILAVRVFLPAQRDEAAGNRSWRSWTEPRTLLLGVLVLAMALSEGTAHDWLAVAIVDGYQLPHWLAALGLATFLTAMMLGRIVGTALLDRFGRVRMLSGSIAVAAVGVCTLVLGSWAPVAFVGALLWGVGAALGFPVAMSAAADQPEHAAARVGVVSTVGYTAFLAGPPLLGHLGTHYGVLPSLLVVAVVLVPSALATPAARPLAARSTSGTVRETVATAPQGRGAGD